jgi:hypothetical protein
MKGTKAEKPAKAKPAKAAVQKTVTAKPSVKTETAELDSLILENITIMTKQLEALTLTVDSHLLKTANIANHVVALEAVLAEVVSMTGLDLISVNNRIRSRIASAAAEPGSADLAIDLAAYIAAPKPRI